MTVDRYHPALVVLHWILGLLIVLGLFMGTFSLERLPNSDPSKLDSLRGHMINGAVIGCLMVVRLIIRARTRRPVPAATGMAWADAIGPWTHRALYGLVFAMVASGVALGVSTDLPGIVFGASEKPLPATFNGSPDQQADSAARSRRRGHGQAWAAARPSRCRIARRSNLRLKRYWTWPR